MKRYLEEIPELDYVLLAIDHTPWEMADAKTMKDRGYQHCAKAKNATVLGQGYSTMAWLPPSQGKRTQNLTIEQKSDGDQPKTITNNQRRSLTIKGDR
jgi:hypothetical protein